VLFVLTKCATADPSGRAVYGVRLRPNCGFESRQGHGCLSLMRVVCYQVEVSELGCSLIQRSPTECRVSECDREASITKPTRAVAPWYKNMTFELCVISYIFKFFK